MAEPYMKALGSSVGHPDSLDPLTRADRLSFGLVLPDVIHTGQASVRWRLDHMYVVIIAHYRYGPPVMMIYLGGRSKKT